MLGFCVLFIPTGYAQEISLSGDGRFVVPRGLAEDYITMATLQIPAYGRLMQNYELTAYADSLLVYSLGEQIDLINEHLRITMEMTAAEQKKSLEWENLYIVTERAYKKERRLRHLVTAVGVVTGVLVVVFK